MASNEMGINRLTDVNRQIALMHKLIRTVPGERTPRRRLIHLYLSHGNLPEAEQAIAVARRDIGSDNVIDRYRCVFAMRRAEQTEGLLDEDRRAMLLEAERLAKRCITNQRYDRYKYPADVGLALARRFSDSRVLVEAIEVMKTAESDIPDPDFSRERRSFEDQLRRISIDWAAADIDPELGESLLTDTEA